MAETFVCANCGGIFELDPEGDGTAREELAANFPGSRVEDCAIVCSACYRGILAVGDAMGLPRTEGGP